MDTQVVACGQLFAISKVVACSATAQCTNFQEHIEQHQLIRNRFNKTGRTHVLLTKLLYFPEHILKNLITVQGGGYSVKMPRVVKTVGYLISEDRTVTDFG